MDLRRAERVADEPSWLRARHQDGIRRHRQRQAASQRDRVSAQPVTLTLLPCRSRWHSLLPNRRRRRAQHLWQCQVPLQAPHQRVRAPRLPRLPARHRLPHRPAPGLRQPAARRLRRKSGPNAPTEGVTRPQGGQVTGQPTSAGGAGSGSQPGQPGPDHPAYPVTEPVAVGTEPVAAAATGITVHNTTNAGSPVRGQRPAVGSGPLTHCQQPCSSPATAGRGRGGGAWRRPMPPPR